MEDRTPQLGKKQSGFFEYQKTGVTLLQLDNLTDLLHKLNEQERAKLQAEIQAVIDRWVEIQSHKA